VARVEAVVALPGSAEYCQLDLCDIVYRLWVGAMALAEVNVEVIGGVISALALIAGMTSGVLDAINAARERETRLRRAAGWFIAVLALAAVAGGVWWLVGNDIPVRQWPGQRVAWFSAGAVLVGAVAILVALQAACLCSASATRTGLRKKWYP
jgi:cation transport ATPase